jgi:hypothetical protein
MKAITFAKNGGIEVIDLTPDLPASEPAPTEVVIKVARRRELHRYLLPVRRARPALHAFSDI